MDWKTLRFPGSSRSWWGKTAFAPMMIIEFINRAICAPTAPLGGTPDWSWSNTTAEQFEALSRVCKAAEKEGFDVDFNRPLADMGAGVFSGVTDRRSVKLAYQILQGSFEEWRTRTTREQSAKFSLVVFLGSPENPFHLLIGRARLGAFLKLDLASAQVSGRFPHPGDFQHELRTAARGLGVELIDGEGSEAVVVCRSRREHNEQEILDFLTSVRAFTERFAVVLPSTDLRGYRP